LIAPGAREIGGGKEFESFGALPLCNRERLTITLLGRHSLACGVQQIASQLVQTGFVSPLFSGFNDLLSFGEAIQALRRLRQLSVRSGEVPRRLVVVRHLDASSEVSLFSVRTNISINDLVGALLSTHEASTIACAPIPHERNRDQN
jgi:hypothetical protein